MASLFYEHRAQLLSHRFVAKANDKMKPYSYMHVALTHGHDTEWIAAIIARGQVRPVLINLMDLGGGGIVMASIGGGGLKKQKKDR